MSIALRARFVSMCVGAAMCSILCVPFIVRGQTSTDVQSQISLLVQQLISIEAQIAQLLGAQPSQASGPYSFGSVLSSIVPTFSTPQAGEESVSSMLLRGLGPLSLIDESSVDLFGLPYQTTPRSVATISAPSCKYFGESHAEGAKRTGDACPGSQCNAAGPELTCKKGEWYYVTNVSVCTPPGFLLDTDAERAYRIALGCKR